MDTTKFAILEVINENTNIACNSESSSFLGKKKKIRKEKLLSNKAKFENKAISNSMQLYKDLQKNMEDGNLCDTIQRSRLGPKPFIAVLAGS